MRVDLEFMCMDGTTLFAMTLREGRLFVSILRDDEGDDGVFRDHEVEVCHSVLLKALQALDVAAK